jgi:DNA mismatch repair protein MutL
MDTPYDYANKKVAAPAIEVDADFNPFRELHAKQGGTAFKKERTESWESLYVGLGSATANTASQESELSFESEEVNAKLFDEDNELSSNGVTYQLHKKYIVSKIKSGMLVIDQHRAHQRVLYENLLKNMTLKEGVSQQLLFPLVLHFSSIESALLLEVKESLENTGFAFSKLDNEGVEITGLPLNVSESGASIILEQLLSDFQNEVPNADFSQVDLMAKSIAKSMAIKNGTVLNGQEQEALLNDLFACKEPTVAPNNKPAFITISMEELDKKFL